MIELANRCFSVGIDPAIGGSLAWFSTAAGAEIFRGARSGGGATDSACFPMVPFCNRVRDRRFNADGRTIMLTPNTADGLRAAHGFGWRSEWTVVERSCHHAVIGHERPAGDWPWAYVARQRIAIDDHGLTIRLSVLNRSSTPMPAGLGVHPYFPLHERTTLRFVAAGCSVLDEQGFPANDPDERLVLAAASEGTLNPAASRYLSGVEGPIVITSPNGGRVAELHASSNCSHHALHVEPAAGLLCIEPMSHRVGALNDFGTEGEASGIRALPPGRSLAMTMRCVVDASPS